MAGYAPQICVLSANRWQIRPPKEMSGPNNFIQIRQNHGVDHRHPCQSSVQKKPEHGLNTPLSLFEHLPLQLDALVSNSLDL